MIRYANVPLIWRYGLLGAPDDGGFVIDLDGNGLIKRLPQLREEFADLRRLTRYGVDCHVLGLRSTLYDRRLPPRGL